MKAELSVLFQKEWRQLLRSKGAMASSLALPALMMLIIPMAQMLGVAFGGAANVNIPQGVGLPPGLGSGDPKELLASMLPLFVAVGGMVAPSIAATYTIISERELRTIELLLALPARIGQILLAKLMALLALSAPLCMVLLAIDSAVILGLGFGDLAFVAALFVLLVAALAYSTASALLIALMARDFRTSNNINGLLFAPIILGSLGVILAVPLGPAAKALTLAGIYLVAAAGCAWISIRAVTFERLLA